MSKSRAVVKLLFLLNVALFILVVVVVQRHFRSDPKRVSPILAQSIAEATDTSTIWNVLKGNALSDKPDLIALMYVKGSAVDTSLEYINGLCSKYSFLIRDVIFVLAYDSIEVSPRFLHEVPKAVVLQCDLDGRIRRKLCIKAEGIAILQKSTRSTKQVYSYMLHPDILAEQLKAILQK